tara:strand:+ start:1315 stop:1431 length:117 start_codon:yes stop_codon:yes gene_type:complete
MSANINDIVFKTMAVASYPRYYVAVMGISAMWVIFEWA